MVCCCYCRDFFLLSVQRMVTWCVWCFFSIWSMDAFISSILLQHSLIFLLFICVLRLSHEFLSPLPPLHVSLSLSYTLAHLILVLIVVWFAVCHYWFISYQTVLNPGINNYLMSKYYMQFSGTFLGFCCRCWYCTWYYIVLAAGTQHKFHHIFCTVELGTSSDLFTVQIFLSGNWFMPICNSTPRLILGYYLVDNKMFDVTNTIGDADECDKNWIYCRCSLIFCVFITIDAHIFDKFPIIFPYHRFRQITII